MQIAKCHKMTLVAAPSYNTLLLVGLILLTLVVLVAVIWIAIACSGRWDRSDNRLKRNLKTREAKKRHSRQNSRAESRRNSRATSRASELRKTSEEKFHDEEAAFAASGKSCRIDQWLEAHPSSSDDTTPFPDPNLHSSDNLDILHHGLSG